MICKNVLSMMLGMIQNDRQSYKEDKIYLYIADMIGDYSGTIGILTICLMKVPNIETFYDMVIHVSIMGYCNLVFVYNWFFIVKIKNVCKLIVKSA